MMTEAQLHRAVALDVGQKVGRLTCRIRWKAAPLYRAYWDCICDCGNSVTVREEHLNSGETRSCGCLNLETVRATAPLRDADPQKVKKRNQPEFEFQKQVMAFLDVSLGGSAWATVFPAGGGGKRRGAQLKAGGLRKGVPDILILDGGRACWLELKAKRGRVSADQVACHAALRRAGASVAVCRTIEDVDAALIRWGVPFNARVLA